MASYGHYIDPTSGRTYQRVEGSGSSFQETTGTRYYFTSGGGSVSSDVQALLAEQQRIATQQEYEKQQKEEKSKEIEAQRLEAQRYEREQYQKDLRQISNLQQRQKRQREFERRLTQITNEARAKRVKEGIVSSAIYVGGGKIDETEARRILAGQTGVVSESIYKDLTEKAQQTITTPTGEKRYTSEALEAQKTLRRIKSYVPQSTLEAMKRKQRDMTSVAGYLAAGVKDAPATKVFQKVKEKSKALFFKTVPESLRREVKQEVMSGYKFIREQFKTKEKKEQIPPGVTTIGPRKVEFEPRKEIAETAKDVIGTVKLVGGLPGRILGKTKPDFGVWAIVPEQEYLTRSTIMDSTVKSPYTFEESKVRLATPRQIQKVGEFGASAAFIQYAPIPVVIGTGTAIATAPRSTTITTEERIEGGVIAAYGVGRGVRWLSQPVTKALTRGEPKISTFEDIVRITYKDQTIDVAGFKVVRQTPAQYGEYWTSRYAKYVKKADPKIIKIAKARTDVAFTPADIVIKEGKIQPDSYFITKRITKTPQTYMKVSKLAGEQKTLTTDSIKNLPRMEQLKLQKLAEIKTGGTPVPMERVPSILGKDFQYSTGRVQAQEVFKLRLKGRRFDIKTPKTGKTITQMETGSTADLIAREGQTEFYKTRMVVKDVTNPLARATGKIPKMEGISRITTLDITPKEVNFIPKTIQTQKTISPKLVQDIKTTMAKTLPKVPSKPVGTITIPDSQALAPTYVGGTGLGVSEYFAKGTYVPEEIIYSQPDLTKTVTIIKPEVIEMQPSKLKVGTETEVKLKQITPVKVDTGMRTDLGIKEKQKEEVISKSVFIQGVREGQKLIEKQVQKEAQISKLSQRMKPFKPTIPIITPTYPIKPPTPTSLLKRARKIIEEKPDEFEVFVKKFGKDVPIGKATTKKEAKTLLVKELKTTLRAGGFVTRRGKKVKPSELGISGFEFRISKRDPFRVVQKKERRLGTRGETKEVQFFRKKKGKKVKFI